MANAAPEDCLFYLSWAGTAKPDPKSGNQLEQLLAEPETQQLAAEVERRIREGLRKAASREGPEAAKMVDELVDLAKKALASPAALYLGKMEIGRRPPPVIQGGAIVSLGEDAAKVRATLERYAKMLPGGAPQEVKVAGERFWTIKPDRDAPTFTLGVHGKHFVLGIGDGEAEAIVKRMAGKPPAWLTQLRQQLPVERPSSVVYVNIARIVGPLPEVIAPDPLTISRPLPGAERTTVHWAWSRAWTRKGFVSKMLLATRREGSEFFAFLTGKPLQAKDLAPIPGTPPWRRPLASTPITRGSSTSGFIARGSPRSVISSPSNSASSKRSLASGSARTCCNPWATCGACTTRPARAAWSLRD